MRRPLTISVAEICNVTLFELSLKYTGIDANLS